jgi:RNA-directed DNA polymerase
MERQHAALKSFLQGHYNYYGVNFTSASMSKVWHQAQRLWFKWLNRRSQRKSFTWERFARYLRVFPRPRPSIRVQIWGNTS